MNQTDTSLDDNQRMLADSARRYLERGYDTQAAAVAASARWREFADLGWLALPVPEAYDGLGGSLADVCVLAEELGRALVHEPWIASSVMSGMLLADVAPAQTAREWLPALAAGDRRVAFAPWEADARHDTSAIGMTASLQAGEWRLDGDKSMAPGAGGANAFIVAARIDDGQLGLFLIEAVQSGVQVCDHLLYDGRRAASLRFSTAGPATLLIKGPGSRILVLIARSLERTVIAHAAETVGTMARAFEITREYLSLRKQFGKPISANQVIQHRLVDLYVEIEEARALTRAAAANPDPRMAAAACAFVSQVARHVWEESIQLHGAIGMTEEYVIGAYVRRMALATSLYGDAHFHLDRLAGLSLGESPELSASVVVICDAAASVSREEKT